MLRAVQRDLDRITRIVYGTARKEEAAAPRPADVPSTVFEAYRILGLNPEAPPAAVKKVVDALRMSWHPDHARSEADRRHREERIKQINAAWDLLKTSQAAAA
jgi:DnaJ-class molecular chaperone